jgi:hypothetical protein
MNESNIDLVRTSFKFGPKLNSSSHDLTEQERNEYLNKLGIFQANQRSLLNQPRLELRYRT